MPFQDRMVIDSPYRDALRRLGLGDVQSVLTSPGTALAAWSRTSDTIRQADVDGNPSVFVKRYHYPTWGHRIRGFFRGTFFQASRACSEFHTLRLMRELGIQAVRPIAFGERRICRFLKSCFLITEAVPESMSLSTFILRYGKERGSGTVLAIRREVLTSLARQVRHMHEAGFVHRDLFWRNVLIRFLPEGRLEFYFLDASVGKRIRMQPWRQDSIVRDIAAMGVLAPDFCSKADQLRFLQEYLNKPRLAGVDRRWLRRVQAHSDQLREGELKRLERGAVFEPPLLDSAEGA